MRSQRVECSEATRGPTPHLYGHLVKTKHHSCGANTRKTSVVRCRVWWSTSPSTTPQSGARWMRQSACYRPCSLSLSMARRAFYLLCRPTCVLLGCNHFFAHDIHSFAQFCTACACVLLIATSTPLCGLCSLHMCCPVPSGCMLEARFIYALVHKLLRNLKSCCFAEHSL